MDDAFVAYVADAYVPLLFLLASALLVRTARLAERIQLTAQATGLVLVIATSYVFMMLDKVLLLWPRFDLDYSTHTAVALALVIHLHLFSTKKRWEVPISFIVYLWLMYRMNYHTWSDMVTTTLVVFPFMVVASNLLKKRKNKSD